MATAAKTKISGKISQIVGVVVDVEFPLGSLPAIYNALEVQNGDVKVTMEVAQHLSETSLRAISLGSTDGLERGTEVVDTGAAIQVPVGEETLGLVGHLRLGLLNDVVGGAGFTALAADRGSHVVGHRLVDYGGYGTGGGFHDLPRDPSGFGLFDLGDVHDVRRIVEAGRGFARLTDDVMSTDFGRLARTTPTLLRIGVAHPGTRTRTTTSIAASSSLWDVRHRYSLALRLSRFCFSIQPRRSFM